jgi:sugar diacid utilization regulator
MAFLINDLLKLDIMKDAELSAGREGLNNEIIWLNMMEILDQLDNIQPGELLLTTGYNLDKEELNNGLIYKLQRKKLAGIAIQPGYYIQEIPANIVEDGNLYGFPVIKVPKKITFSHVTRTIFSKIHNSNSFIHAKEWSNMDQLLLNIIKNKSLTHDETSYLANILKTDESSGFCCMILSVQHREKGFIDKLCLENIISRISDYLSSKCYGEIYQELITECIFLLSLKPEFNMNNITQSLNNIMQHSYEEFKNVSIRLSISSVFYDLSRISEAYDETSINLETMNRADIKKGICCSNNLHIMQLLSNSQLLDSFIRFYRNVLKPIENFDIQHNTNYLFTLKAFFSNNCNFNKTSDSLFIHRHTLRYRLEKIKEICSIDFNDYNSLFTHQLAFFIHELYE